MKYNFPQIYFGLERNVPVVVNHCLVKVHLQAFPQECYSWCWFWFWCWCTEQLLTHTLAWVPLQPNLVNIEILTEVWGLLDLCLVWTPMPQVTEQELHVAQVQSLSGRNIYFVVVQNSCISLISPVKQALAKANGGV